MPVLELVTSWMYSRFCAVRKSELVLVLFWFSLVFHEAHLWRLLEVEEETTRLSEELVLRRMVENHEEGVNQCVTEVLGREDMLALGGGNDPPQRSDAGLREGGFRSREDFCFVPVFGFGFSWLVQCN